MEEEAVSIKLRKSLQSSKEFVSKGYHNFTDYINKTYTEHKEKGHNKTVKMALAKYVLVFLNIFYMLTSLVMINIGAIGQIINANYYFWSGLDLLSIYWIATGVILLCASIFGMIGAFKESIIWTNIFGVLMTIVFIIQISSAIISFQFIGKSQDIAWNGISNLMSQYGYGGRSHRMDWIQQNFQCCGNDGPSDWNTIGKFARPSNDYNNYNYYHRSSTTTTSSTPLLDRMPASCCTDGSNYTNLTCENYYPSGCCIHIREMISESVMIIGSVALTVAVLEILGIVFAFVVAKIMRKTKSFIAIQHYDALANVPNNGETQPAKVVEIVAENAETI